MMLAAARYPATAVAFALLAWAPAQDGPAFTSQAKVQQSHFFETPMLVGAVETADLRQEPFPEWFTPGYQDYRVQPDALTRIVAAAAADSALSIEVFFGTWCDDSRRELPGLLRILDDARFPENRVGLYALSDNPGVFKMTPDGREHELFIHRTPTIVVLRDGVELGRIVEKPEANLEDDLAAILTDAPAAVPYGAESAIHLRYRTNDLALIRAPSTDFLEELEELGDTETLWHYAQYDLLFNGRPADAADVLHLFLTLHPESALGYRLLAQAESELGNSGAALFAVRRALAIDPDSGAAKRLEQRILDASGTGSSEGPEGAAAVEPESTSRRASRTARGRRQ